MKHRTQQVDIPQQLTIAVVGGGGSAEREVSHSSAEAVATALRETFESVTLLELDAGLVGALLAGAYDVVFPVLHGPLGEDGTLQGCLETLGLPYVGSGVRASACAMHKPTAKLVFAARGLPVVPGFVAESRQTMVGMIPQIIAALGDDVVVKPCGQGSALGVGFAKGPAVIRRALDAAFGFGDEALVERRIPGREITVGVLDDEDGCHALPVVEVRTPAGSWYDFHHRYTPGLSEHVVPARLSGALSRRIQAAGVAAHRALACRDLSRSDMVVTEAGEIFLLETNTLPGMTPNSLYPDAARAAGIPFPDLVHRLVRRAWHRGNGSHGQAWHGSGE